MANFKVYPGIFMMAMEDVGPIKVGTVVQVLAAPVRPYFFGKSFMTLVGFNWLFKLDHIKWVPIFPEQVE